MRQCGREKTRKEVEVNWAGRSSVKRRSKQGRVGQQRRKKAWKEVESSAQLGSGYEGWVERDRELIYHIGER